MPVNDSTTLTPSGISGNDSSTKPPTTGMSGNYTLTSTKKPPPINKNEKKNCECGRTSSTPKLSPRIAGGFETEPHKYPWQIQIGYLDKAGIPKGNCGASLITKSHLLTAPHCVVFNGTVSKPEDLIVKVGGHIKIGFNDIGDLKKLEKIEHHPMYRIVDRRASDTDKQLYFQLYYDFAILTLKEPVAFDETISPICLPAEANNRHEYENGTVIGWGELYTQGPNPEELTEVSVLVQPLHVCDLSHKGMGLQE